MFNSGQKWKALNTAIRSHLLLGNRDPGPLAPSIAMAGLLPRHVTARSTQLIGIGMNKYFLDDDGLMLDVGEFICTIEWAADVEAIVMGKPSADLFEQVALSTGVPATNCLMVGDDVVAHIAGAVDAGLQGRRVRASSIAYRDIFLSTELCCSNRRACGRH